MSRTESWTGPSVDLDVEAKKKIPMSAYNRSSSPQILSVATALHLNAEGSRIHVWKIIWPAYAIHHLVNTSTFARAQTHTHTHTPTHRVIQISDTISKEIVGEIICNRKYFLFNHNRFRVTTFLRWCCSALLYTSEGDSVQKVCGGRGSWLTVNNLEYQ
jgi:hypothetical protein